MYDVIIIGAGAAGLTAAFQLMLENPSFSVLILERGKTTGRKLAAAGNGKCNLTNSVWNAPCFFSQDQQLLDRWSGRHTTQEVCAFWESAGMMLYERDGYYYPVSNMGKQVTLILNRHLKRMGVTIQCNTVVRKIEKQKGTFRVEGLEDGTGVRFSSRYVIVATGGKAAPGLGGTEQGYNVLKQMGLQFRSVYPVLCPIQLADPLLPLAKGVRLDAEVTFQTASVKHKERGQVQFNEDGLSGIVIMNQTCYYWPDSENAVLTLDVLPDVSWDALAGYFQRQTQAFPDESLICMLEGLFPLPFVQYVLRRLRIGEKLELCAVTQKQWNKLTSLLKKMEWIPGRYMHYEKAQATAGGISLQEVSMECFESVRYKGLYIVGETLDVNGKCGGYNLSFAVLSAIEAAKHITKKYKGELE